MTGAPVGPPGLRGRRILARQVLWFERLWPAVLPALWVLGVFLCAALLDLPPLLPWWSHGALLACLGGAIGFLLWRGLSRLARPDEAAADRRLERDSGLNHRPLAALADKPVTNDPIGLALWRAHVARGLARIGRLRLKWPSPGVAAWDRRSLRHAVLLGLLTTLAIAGRDTPGRLAAAFAPGLPRAAAPRALDLQAWIAPPAYTGLAPVFLKRDQASVAVPVGSKITVNLSGGEAVPELIANGTRTVFGGLDRTSFQVAMPLENEGRVAVVRDGADLAAWTVTLIPDQPPTARWTDPPGRSENGTRVRLPWSVADDYGVATARVELRLAARAAAAPVDIAVSLPGGSPKSAHGILAQDLIAHPWAGLGVVARLVARDGAGQTGASEDSAFELPERVFSNEIARALIAMRKGLSVNPDDRGDALAALDDLMQSPQKFGADSGSYLNLSAIYYLLVRNKRPAAIDEAQARMWELALHLEEGQTEETARALEVARQAVRDALDRLERAPTDENRQALDQKLKELREAIDRHLQAMMQEAERNKEALPFDPEAEQLTQQDLDRMAEDAREAAREGRTDEARDKMAELEKMLDRLKQARADKGQGNSQERQKGRRQMGAVQDLVAREGAVLDHTEGRAALNNAPKPHRIDPAEAEAARQRPEDQRVQQALRRALGEMMQQFGDLTGEIPPALTEADQAMREAGQRLGAGDDKGAAAAEQRAIEALQKGAREMGRALAKQFGRGQRGEGSGEGDGFGAEGPMGSMMPDGRGNGRSNGAPMPGSPNRADSRGRDPLGRTNQGNGLEAGDVHVPEEAERQRSQAIQEELRRRGAERERPRRELDYIDRLLRQF